MRLPLNPLCRRPTDALRRGLPIALLAVFLAPAPSAMAQPHCPATFVLLENQIEVPGAFAELPPEVLVDVTAGAVHSAGRPVETVTVTAQPAVGVADVVGGFLRYRRMGASAAEGHVSIGYQVAWQGGLTSSGQVCIGNTCTVGGPIITPKEDAATLALDGGPQPIYVLRNDEGSGLTIEGFTPATLAVGTVAKRTTAAGEDYLEVTPTAAGTDFVAYTATDGVSSATSTVTVTVEAAPEPPVDAVDDGPFTLTFGEAPQALFVLANDTPGGLTISSFTSSPLATIVKKLHNGQEYLEATPATTGTGSFTYTATDGVTSDTATVFLRVEAPPLVITEQPQNAALVTGADVQFRVRASGGVPPYQFDWSRNGTDLFAARHTIADSADGSTLTYTKAELTGTYQVAVTDSAGAQILSRVARLDFVYLNVLQAPGELLIGAGQSGAIEIRVDTNGNPPVYQWHFNGSPIATSDVRFQGARSARLVLVGADSSMAGDYRVTVDNQLHLERTGHVRVVTDHRLVADSFDRGWSVLLNGATAPVGGAVWAASSQLRHDAAGGVFADSVGIATLPFHPIAQSVDPGGFVRVEAEATLLDRPGHIFGVGLFRGTVERLGLYAEYVDREYDIEGFVTDYYLVTLRDGSNNVIYSSYEVIHLEDAGNTTPDPVDPRVGLRLYEDGNSRVEWLGKPNPDLSGPRWSDYASDADHVGFSLHDRSTDPQASTPRITFFSAGPDERLGPAGSDYFDSFTSRPAGTALQGVIPDLRPEGDAASWKASNLEIGDGRVLNAAGKTGWGSLPIAARYGHFVTLLEADVDFLGAEVGWVALGFGPTSPAAGELVALRLVVHASGFYRLQAHTGTWTNGLSGNAPSFVTNGGPNRIRLTHDRLHNTIDLEINGVTVGEDVSTLIDGMRLIPEEAKVWLSPSLATDPSARHALDWLAVQRPWHETDYRDTFQRSVQPSALHGQDLESSYTNWSPSTWEATAVEVRDGYAEVPNSRGGFGTFAFHQPVHRKTNGIAIEADVRVLQQGWAAFGGWTAPNTASYANGALYLRLFHDGRLYLVSGTAGQTRYITNMIYVAPGFQAGDWVRLRLEHDVPLNTAGVYVNGLPVLLDFDLDAWGVTPDYDLVGMHMLAALEAPWGQQHVDNLQVSTFETSALVAETFTAYGFDGRALDGGMNGAALEASYSATSPGVQSPASAWWVSSNNRFGTGSAYSTAANSFVSTDSMISPFETRAYSVDVEVPLDTSWGGLALAASHTQLWNGRVYLNVTPGGKANLVIPGVFTRTSSVPVSADGWYRLELVIDGAERTMQAFVEGIEVLEKTSLAALGVDLFDGSAARVVVHRLDSGDYTVMRFDNFLIAEEPRSLAPRRDSVGFSDPAVNTKWLFHALGESPAAFAFGFGKPGWKTVAGDWDGAGTGRRGSDSIGVYDPATGTFYLRNVHAGGTADATFVLGPSGTDWIPISGDFDGDGVDTVSLFDPELAEFHLRNSNDSGSFDLSFAYGGGGWMPLTGDWDGDGVDSIGVFDPSSSTFYLRNSNGPGLPDFEYPFGTPGSGEVPVAGDWDGDGVDTVGVFDKATGTFRLTNLHGGGVEREFTHCCPSGTFLPMVGRWGL